MLYCSIFEALWLDVRPWFDNGFRKLDHKTEHAVGLVAICRKCCMLAGFQRRGNSMTIALTQIATAKQYSVDLQSCLTDLQSRIAEYKIAKLDELIPLNYNSVT